MTTPRVLTGSSLDRAESCPASATLPQLPDRVGAAAIRGTKLHTQLENRDPELAERLAEQGDSLDELWPEGGVHEALVWYDPLSQDAGWEPKPKGTHRDYAKFPDHVLVGTVDYLNPALGLVDDLKSGIYVPPPTSLQTGLGSVALARGSGLREVTASMTQVRPKFPALRTEHHHSERGLLETRGRLDRLYGDHLLNKARVAAGFEPTKNPTAGNCRFCKADCDVRFSKEKR